MRSSFLFGCCFSPTRFRLNIRLMNIRYRIRLHKYKKIDPHNTTNTHSTYCNIRIKLLGFLKKIRNKLEQYQPLCQPHECAVFGYETKNEPIATVQSAQSAIII